MNLTFDFAFEGFRIIRERPKLIAFWGAITLFGYGVMSLIMVSMAGPELITYNNIIQMYATAFAASGTPPKYDQALLSLVFQQISYAMLVCLPVYLVMNSVLACAVYRVVLGETDDRLGYLAFGLQELRIIVAQIMTLGVVIAVFTGVCLVGFTLAMLIGAASPQAAAGIQTLTVLAASGVTVWFNLRLSLNGPQSFDTRKVDIFGSFGLTNERFWSLFTGYATAIALAYVVRFLIDKIIEAVQILGLGFKVTGDIILPDTANLTAFLTPSTIILLVMTFAIISPLMAAIQLGAPAAAYRVLRGKAIPRKVEETV